MKNIFLSICLLISFAVQSQSQQFDDYKYIVVSKKNDGLKKENQYQTSTLVKYLFTQRGFTTVFEDSMPTDLNKDPCLGLYVNLIDASSILITKASLILKNCSGEEVFVTKQGKSKHKDYKAAYSEVLSEAMKSFEGIKHNYKPKKSNTEEAPITVSFRNDIKKLEEKPRLIICKNKIIKQEATLKKQSFEDKTPVVSDIKKASNTKKEMLEQKNGESTNKKNDL